MDHRSNLRVKVRLPVEVATQEGVISGTTIDLSFEGASVELSADPSALRTTVRVRFEPGAVGLNVPAMVVRQEGTELGLMFGHYDRTVDEYLTRRLSDAIDGVIDGSA